MAQPTRLIFQLVQSRRQDGRVRQHLVDGRYIGSIRQDRVADISARADLWRTAENALRKLDLAEAQSDHVRQQLSKYVSKPRERELARMASTATTRPTNA